MVSESLWRNADFRKLWVGQTVSELGSVVTRTAVPLVALLVLGAGPLEMALLVVSAGLAVLLVGFFAGAWVDRLRRRPLLIWADAMRAVLLFSIPAAYLAGVLRIEQLYLVVFLEGCLRALFDAAYQAMTTKIIGQPGRHVIVIISDGDDNVSEKTIEETIEMAQKTDTVIYAVGTNSPELFGSATQAWPADSYRRSGRRSRSSSTRSPSWSRPSRWS